MEPRKKILDEAHTSMFTLHPGSNKMYQDLKQKFWWTRMKREIAKYVYECDVCQRVKADHLKPAGMLQPLAVPARKWEDIHMDFIVGLPRTRRDHYRAKQYAELYISRIVSLHGVPLTITSDEAHRFCHASGAITNCSGNQLNSRVRHTILKRAAKLKE
ncbi:hypothetical protein U9M48_032292 [Paspalum notatum var. saurae]|uniref:Integrase zinc-binding domain-containing protein n=1 Tax=Paspalum notatum var. saurae TaxID=547442 RepID=A0AAQ3U4R2_PASNO